MRNSYNLKTYIYTLSKLKINRITGVIDLNQSKFKLIGEERNTYDSYFDSVNIPVSTQLAEYRLIFIVIKSAATFIRFQRIHDNFQRIIYSIPISLLNDSGEVFCHTSTSGWRKLTNIQYYLSSFTFLP